MTKPVDDLEAVRTVVEAVQGFKEDEQQRIFRWAAEKLGLKSPFGTSAHPTTTAPTAAVAPTVVPNVNPLGTPPVNGSGQPTPGQNPGVQGCWRAQR